MRRRIKSLPVNAVLMLENYWDGKPLSFEGWEAFWKLVQAAQGYDVKYPAWFEPPAAKHGKPKPDTARHTGSSHGINRFKDPKEAVREDDHNWQTFRDHYDGLKTVPDTAEFCSLYPHSMPITQEQLDQIHTDLIDHELIKASDPIPTRPTVPVYNVKPPVRTLWLPKIADKALRDEIWTSNTETAAKKLGTSAPWLIAICRAKRIPLPRAGNGSRANPDAAPIPPPLVTMPPEELAQIIHKLHGVQPAAQKLGVNYLHLSAYCAVHRIQLPSTRDRALYYNNRPRVAQSRSQIRTLLNTLPSVDAVAAELKISVEELRTLCHRRGIVLETVKGVTSITLEEIKAALRTELALQPRRPLENVEAMEMVLSKCPQGLPEPDLINVVKEAIGNKLDIVAPSSSAS